MQFGATATVTFWVNVSGSFLLGVLAGAAVGADARTRLLLGSGFLGGYTTFSTLELEALLAWRAEGWRAPALLLAGSAGAGFAAVAGGYFVGSRLR